MNLAISRRKFDEILPFRFIEEKDKQEKEKRRGGTNYAGISQKWSGNDKMSRDLEKKCQKNSGNARNFWKW